MPTHDSMNDDSLSTGVAMAGSGRSIWWIVGVAVALGLVAFFLLSSRRQVQYAPPPHAATASVASIEPPPDVTQAAAAARTPPLAPTPAVPFAYVPPAPTILAAEAPTGRPELRQRLEAPAVIVDLSAPTHGQEAAAKTSGAGPSGSAAKSSGAERFAERVSGATPEQARAGMLQNPSFVVPQGTIIPAVLETALNSELPGYARAVVSRDIYSFDGKRILIPRTSRLIGEYQSAVAQGTTRAFVIWTRLIRPDGASIQIASPTSDPLGRAGLDGKVNRHYFERFFERFGGSLLLAVVDGLAQSIAPRSSTQVVVSSAQDASGLASLASANADIPPTIEVAQGAPIRVFVAKDLDFSGVAQDGARP